ncbi:MAG: branched-chain amino acid ABC transporter permease [Candidatus Heimdallarchaeota archaeon]
MEKDKVIEKLEDIWDDIRDRGYYIIGVSLLFLFPLIIVTPSSRLPPPFTFLNSFFGGGDIPIISDIYALGRSSGLFGNNAYILNILSLCAIWAIFAAAWDFLSGYTGQVSFGHAIFWGLAAYVTFWVGSGFTVGLIYVPLGIPILDQVLEIAISLINLLLQGLFGTTFQREALEGLIYGGIISALFATIIGIIALRVKGPYLALVTLLLPLIASQIVVIFTDLFGPSYGIPFITGPFIIDRLNPSDLPQDLASRAGEINELNFYILTIIILFVSVGIMMMIAYSRIGLVFQSIREEEDAAESLGINIEFYKILAFAGSAFFAGIAGGMYAQYLRHVGPSMFEPSFSFSIIIMCVIGGIGSISGGVIGAFLLTILTNLFLGNVFQDIQGLDILAFGILLILTLRYMPYGLARSTKDQKRAVVIGLLFALAWVLIPSSLGWGGSFIEGVASALPLGTDIFSQWIAFGLGTLTNYIGKIDFLGQLFFTAGGDIIVAFALLIIFIFGLIASGIFFLTETFALFVLQEILGLGYSWGPEDLIKAKFLIYVTIGIPFAYYLPKAFKKVRLKLWGIWPSAGRYEPD